MGLKDISCSPMMEKRLCILFLILFTGMLHFVFIQALAPVQMGWFNYYGWLVHDGAVLYKDLYYFLPPQFILMHVGLYSVFGNHMMLYQVAGMVVIGISILCVYDVLCAKFPPVYAAMGCAGGLLIVVGAVLYFPTDYNQILMSLVIFSVYFLARSLQYDGALSLLGAGFFLGMAIFSKQSVIVFALGLLGLYCLVLKKHNAWNVVFKKLAFLMIGVLLGSLPSVLYLIPTDTFWLSIEEQIQAAIEAKGNTAGIEGIFSVFPRFYRYGFSYAEFGIALCSVSLLVCQNTARAVWGVSIRTGLVYLLYHLVIYKIFRIYQHE